MITSEKCHFTKQKVSHGSCVQQEWETKDEINVSCWVNSTEIKKLLSYLLREGGMLLQTLDRSVCCHIMSKTSVCSIQSFLCGFEKMLNVFREDLRVIEAHRMEDIAPLMDPDSHSILLGQVMFTFHWRNKRLHEWERLQNENDLFKSLLLCICLQFRLTMLLMREKLLILTCKTSALHQSCRYGHVVTGHASDFWKKSPSSCFSHRLEKNMGMCWVGWT